MKLEERKRVFLEKLRKLYGDRYDLSRAYNEYHNIASKITIICPIHGEVEMRASTLLRGKGCKLCSRKRTAKTLSINLKGKHQDQQEWIDYCTKKHNGKYDYSLVDFDNKRSDGKIPIICHELGEDGEEHGVFWQLPNQHKWGKGCKKCKTLTSRKIIERAMAVHGDKYDYSLLKYKGMLAYVDIKCNTCGKTFPIIPHNLLKGKGCPYCAVDKRIKKLQLPINAVKDRINEKFNSRYCLDKIEYKNVDTPVTIICPIHGEFKQTPFQLFNGCGCPKCGQSALENEIQVFLDNNNIISEYEVNKKRFEWLGMQSIDFYLPEYNVAIECQGIQHFKPQAFTNASKEKTEEIYKNTLRLDSQKKKLCEEHGIKLFYYSNLGIEYPYEVFEDKDLLLKIILNKEKNEQDY